MQQSWTRRRIDPDAKGGLRLTLAVGAAFVALVPFALALVAVTDGWSPLRRLDLNVANDLNTAAVSHPGLVSFLELVSNVFSPTTFEVVAVLCGLVLLLRHSPRLAAWLVLTVVLTDPLDTLIKDSVARSRPHFAHPVETLTSYSFPSGHAFGSIVGVGALLLVGLPSVRASWRRPLIVLGVLIVLLVGYARIGLGVHYVSDVLGGWLIGAAWLAATTAAFRAWRRDLRRPDRPLEAGLEPAGPEPAGSTSARREA
jgi:membrane-associated phospholipid phosphatase